MSSRALDRLLGILIAALVGSGLVTLRAGSPATAPLFALHGLLGGALALAVLLKLSRSVPRAIANRRWGRLALSIALTATVAVALSGGFAWVASGRILSIGPWTILTVHVFAALALVPIAVAHLLPHRWRLLRPVSGGGRSHAAGPLVSRRTALAVGATAVTGAVAWIAANSLNALAGGRRRFTGSRWLPPGGVPAATTFFGEQPEEIDAGGWRLAVRGRVARTLDLSVSDLATLGQVDRDEVLDCTSGWALRTSWRGVPLATVLDEAGIRSRAKRVVVRSTTGWYAELPIAEAREALLATAVAGRPLPHGNGAPCRLVAPGRRGLEWVKWIVRIEVS